MQVFGFIFYTKVAQTSSEAELEETIALKAEALLVSIKEKAEEVYNNSFKEIDEMVENARKNLEYMTGSYRASFLPIQSQMKELSRAFGVSKQMAGIAKTIPSVVFDIQRPHPLRPQPIWKELRKFQNILDESVKIYSPIKDIQTAYSPIHIIPSPILRAKSLFSKVTDKELESKKSVSDILEKDEKEIDESDSEYIGFLKNIDEKVTGERSHLHLHLKVSEKLDWKETIGKLKSTYPAWVTPSGPDSVYRLTHADMLSCVSISRGSNANEIWMAAEPRVESVEAQKKEFFTAYGEVASVLDQMNIWVVTPKLKS